MLMHLIHNKDNKCVLKCFEYCYQHEVDKNEYERTNLVCFVYCIWDTLGYITFNDA